MLYRYQKDHGRKKLFLCGLVIALLASVVGGFATRIEFLIACMGLFGLAGSMILPLSQALLVHQFPELCFIHIPDSSVDGL